MESHVLLRLASRFGTAEPAVEPHWVYDRTIGAWVAAGTPDTLMVTPPKPSPTPPKSPPPPPPPPRPRPRSKKEDVETGEDMKGT